MADANLQILLKARDDASAAITRLQGRMGSLGSSMSALRGPALLAGGAILGLATKFAGAGSAIFDMSTRTGLSTEAISELKFAVEQSGGSIEGLEKGMKRVASIMLDAEQGTETAVQTFDALGLKVEDLRALSPDQLFDTLAAAIAGVDDPMQKAALATEVFGRAGTNLIPLFEEGTEGMAELRQQARDLGIVMDAETAAKADRLGDAMDAAKSLVLGLATTVGSMVAGPLSAAFEAFNALPGPIRQMTAAVVALSVAAKFGLAPNLLSLATSALPMIGTALGFILPLMLGPVGLVVALAAVGGAAFLFRDQIKAAFQDILDWLRDNWAEVATGVQAFIIGPFVLPFALASDAFGIRTALLDAMQDLKDRIEPIVDSIVQFFLDIPGRLADVGRMIGNAIIDALNAALQMINNVIPDRISLPLIPDIDLPDNPLPLIPRLARGGIVTRPTLAFLGEQGPEAVIPLRRNGHEGMEGGTTINLTVNALDARGAADAVVQALTHLERTGRLRRVTI